MFLQSVRELWDPPTQLRTLAVPAKVSIDGVYKKERESGRGISLPTHSVRDHQTPLIPVMKLVSDPTRRRIGWLQQRLMGGIVCIYKHFWGVRAFCFTLFLVEPVFCSAFFALLFPKESFTFPNIGTFAASTCTYQFHVSYKAEGLHCFLYFFYEQWLPIFVIPLLSL